MQEKETLTPEEAELLKGAPAVPLEDVPEEVEEDEQGVLVPRRTNEPPPWAIIPPPSGARKMPPGRQIVYMRFRAEWTDTPDLGDRQCIMWNINVGDEKVAIQRAGDFSASITREFAKQQVRVVDGHWAEYGQPMRAPDGIDRWWNEIGYKCRSLIMNHWGKQHMLTANEKIDFLASCIAVRVEPR